MGAPRAPHDWRSPLSSAGRSPSGGSPARQPRCRFCQTPITPAQAALHGGSCADWRCRRRYLAELQQQARLAKQAAQEAWDQRILRSAALRDRAARQQLRPDAEAFVPAPLPINRQHLAPLPRRRTEAFLEHLRQVIAAGFAEPAPNTATSPADADAGPAGEGDPAQLLEQACALCRGRCCRCGENHAYLSPELIGRYRRSHPEAGAEQVFQAYEACLGEVTFEDSCVYHQPQGCGLPRRLRSDACNHFACQELEQLQLLVSRSSGVPAVCLVASDPADDDPRILFWTSPRPSPAQPS